MRRAMANRLNNNRRKALLAVVLIPTLIFLLTLTGNPYSALSRYLFGAGPHERSSGPTVFQYGTDQVSVGHGHHRLYADRVDRLSDASVSIIHKSHASVQITANCSRAAQLGATAAASWMLCTAGPFWPQPPCFAISFDTNAKWRFEAAKIAATFGCQSIVFDPTMPPSRGQQVNGNLVQLNEGLHHPRAMGSWRTDTYLGHLKRLRAQAVVIDVLEVNIGDSGWEPVDTAIADDSLLHVKQLLLAVPVSRNATIEMLRNEIKIVALLDKIGFRLWRHSRKTVQHREGPFVGQFHFINQHFAADDSRARNSDAAVASLRDSIRKIASRGE